RADQAGPRRGVELRAEKMLDVSTDPVQTGRTVEGCHLAAELTGQPEIVGVEERQVVASRTLSATVTGGGAATPLLADIDDFRSDLPHQPGAVIGRAVVDDDDFEQLVALIKDAAERLGNVALGVEQGNDRADQRSLVHS